MEQAGRATWPVKPRGWRSNAAGAAEIQTAVCLFAKPPARESFRSSLVRRRIFRSPSLQHFHGALLRSCRAADVFYFRLFTSYFLLVHAQLCDLVSASAL